MSPLPVRPRLAPSVHCARHVADGRVTVVLFDVGAGVRAELDEARFRLLTHCDGTRDLDGICLAAARDGIYGGEAGIRQLLEDLNEAGLLRDGLPAPTPAPPVPPETASGTRPLEPLPGYLFDCDGRGSCCRFYGMVAFDPAEARRAAGIADRLSLPLAPSQLFTPMSGAQLDEDATRVVAQIEGRCAFLEPDAGCGLHRVGGADAKPAPCRTYPWTYVDDGVAIRVSVAPECACAFASAARGRGRSLVPSGARSSADLPGAPWRALPDPLPLTATRSAPRAGIRAWSAAVLDALDGCADPPRLLLELASGLPEGFLAPLERGPREAPIERLDAALRALADAAARPEVQRSPASGALAARTGRWIAEALAEARAATLLEAPADLEAERFYLRALVHGHRIAPPGRPLADALFDRAVRVLAARAMARAPLRDAAAAPPIALLEAAMRNLGLARYLDPP